MAILLISLLSISAVSAADDAAIDENVLEESINDADLSDIQDDELGQGDENALSDGDDPTPPPNDPSFYSLSPRRNYAGSLLLRRKALPRHPLRLPSIAELLPNRFFS